MLFNLMMIFRKIEHILILLRMIEIEVKSIREFLLTENCIQCNSKQLYIEDEIDQKRDRLRIQKVETF